MSFINLYYRRTAGTARPCDSCKKPTTTVLATINAVDFVYICPLHLSDQEFASIVPNDDPSSTSGKNAVTAEEIAKVKAEWEEKKKREKAKEKEKEDKGKETDVKGEKEKKKEDSLSPKLPGSLSVSPAPSTNTPTHERYTLHRKYFTMRQDEHRRRRQASQAKELAPRLPGAPKGGFS
ncbi:VPS4-associated protein 1 [Crassisporium funariophilum]|nr:VPS4-associated protein 1 [Crassisporium funariophilum]